MAKKPEWHRKPCGCVRTKLPTVAGASAKGSPLTQVSVEVAPASYRGSIRG